jgi:hypothetical protein
MRKIDSMEELRTVSLKAKGMILRKPGMTHDEILLQFPEKHHNYLVVAIRQMTNNGTVIDRNNQYYALGHSVKAKVKRHRQRIRQNNEHLLASSSK